jgi:hypothetical protein
MSAFNSIAKNIVNHSTPNSKNLDTNNSLTPKNTIKEKASAATTKLVNNVQQENANSNNNNLAKQNNIDYIADYIEIDYDDLEIFERCGRGAYGSVFRGLWKSRNKTVAIKKLIQLENEAEILSMCSHRNIIQFYGIVAKASNYCIITGKCFILRS